MTFTTITTTSSRDWREWGLSNAVVSDGGVSIAWTTNVSTRSIATDVRDVAVDPNGDIAVVTEADRGVVYDHEGTSQRTFVPAGSDVVPDAVDATSGEITVAESATGSVHRIRPGTGRTIDPIDTGLGAISRIATTRDGSMALVDDGLRRFDVKNPTPVSVTDPIDVAGDGERVIVLEHHRDGPRMRALSPGDGRSPDTLAEPPLRFEDERVHPTAVAAVDGRIFLAVELPDDRYGLLEYDDESGSLAMFTTVDGPIRAAAAGTTRQGHATIALVTDPDDECVLAIERDEVSRHPRTNDHRATALYRYDSGANGLEWHRVAIDIARSSVDTTVKMRYHVADTPTLLPITTETSQGNGSSGGDEASITGGDGESNAGGDGESNQGFVWVEETTDQIASTLSSSVREALVDAGIESLFELAMDDPGSIADETSLSYSQVSAARDAALDAIETEIQEHWTETRIDDADALLEDATGRYLFVALELVGTPDASPHVESLTTFCPRTSYLRHLPELYQQDETSAAFLERFLSVFETSFTDIERELESFTRYLDPAGTPTEALDWLESWIAADEYRDWPAPARRGYLARAPELYRRRGTRRGLRETIELYLGHAATRESPNVDAKATIDTGHQLFFLEPGDLDGIADGPALESYQSLLPSPHSFVVFCGPFDEQRHEQAVERIVETETPAHVDASLLSLEDDLVLGPTSFLGRNTTLGTESFALGETQLGAGTYLTAEDD